MKISKLLIANRGEIALRIMRTARTMGYSVVAVYSEQDKHAAHVLEADERVYLPGETLAETYLNIQAIIKATKDTGADAIHPGYGFLSENPLFAEACEKEGIVFIGPSSLSIRAMGNKIAAREIAKKHGVPVTPGITGTPEELLKHHHEVGLPVLVKAAAGGGGKGMRIVRSESEMANALKSTSSEAANYFGDSTIYIERFFENPRHIEVQVLGDKHGNMIHLFERECSVQRRHQKIIEEAPSPTLTTAVREKMCAAAITLASSIGYYNAGTIEFLVDNDLNFYFLEMNTRIQVEHPVTEMITGVDIVKEQFL
jgi:3-methylcrotonyl-CoA carboxylase alpha subunit